MIATVSANRPQTKRQYPRDILFTTVLQADDGPSNLENGVIRDAAELNTALKHLSATIGATVDFEKEQLMFVTLGQRELGESEAQIYRVWHLAERDDGQPSLTTVMYREIRSHAPNVEEKNNPSFPIHVIRLRRLNGDTVFYKDKPE